MGRSGINGPSDRSFDIAHTVVLPARTGKHIVYSIWQRDWETDAAEAFYQCVDVDFGGGSNSSASKSSVNASSTTSSVVTSSVRSSSSSSLSNNACDNLPVWTATAIYTQQMSVQYNGKRYTAKWYTQGQNPEQNSGPWDVWVNLGDCISGPISSSSKSSSAVSSASRSSVQSSASSKSSAANSSSSSTAGKCTSPAYVNGASYATGALVQNVGSEYKCLVGGWCMVGGPYAPGVGWAWTNAWSLVQSCQ